MTTTYSNATIRLNGGPEIPCRSIEIVRQGLAVQHHPGSVVRDITEAQLAYMLIIAYERCDVITPEDLEAHEQAFRRMSHAEGSALIDLWKNLPRQSKAPSLMYDRMHAAQSLKNPITVITTTGTAPAAPSGFVQYGVRPDPSTPSAVVPPTPAPPTTAAATQRPHVDLPPVGRYAMQEAGPPNGDLEWKFYVVTQSRRNTNLRFLQEQYGDNKRPVPYSKLPIVCTVLNSNPKFYMEQYGKQIGRCGKCGRTLTDPESIDRGIGPECWSRM